MFSHVNSFWLELSGNLLLDEREKQPKPSSEEHNALGSALATSGYLEMTSSSVDREEEESRKIDA